MNKKKEENSLTPKQIRESFCFVFCKKNKDCSLCSVRHDSFFHKQYKEFLEVRK